MMLAGGFNPSTPDLQNVYQTDEKKLHARDWLTEQTGTRDWRDRWVSGRDLFLEIVVIFLIGWEISLSKDSDTQQKQNFDAQQVILKDMQTSTKATADNLTSLKNVTEIMNRNVERNASAAEESSATAIKSLAVSERPYVSCVPSPDEPKENEKLRVAVTCSNSGRTPAIEVLPRSSTGLTTLSNHSEEDAHKGASAAVFPAKPASKLTLGPGQSETQIIGYSPPLNSMQLSAIKEGRLIWYIFTEIQYRDTFNHAHLTETCTYYDWTLKAMVSCAKFNNAN